MNDSQFFLEVAEACARQSTCLRRRYGAVIVDSHRHILSTGYNGVPTGKIHCDVYGKCLRDELNIPQGSDYLLCKSNHGEANALIQAGRLSYGCVMYLYGWDVKGMREIIPRPCFQCTKLLINAGIEKVITRYTIFDPHELYESYVSSLYTTDQHYP